jgi:fructose-1,6-bisphosphatase
VSGVDCCNRPGLGGSLSFDSQSPRLEDCLHPGREMVAAGYVLYSSAVVMALSTGRLQIAYYL